MSKIEDLISEIADPRLREEIARQVAYALGCSKSQACRLVQAGLAALRRYLTAQDDRPSA